MFLSDELKCSDLFSTTNIFTNSYNVVNLLECGLFMQDYSTEESSSEMDLLRLFPYWLDTNQGNAILNDVNMRSLFILTGPNGGGKSSMLRSVCAAALLGVCGLMVPAASAVIPHFDSIMLHMKAYDSPADGKSSFQVPIL